MIWPHINMNLPQVYTCSPSWTLLPLPSPYHPSGSSQCTSPKHPVSCIKPGLEIHFIYDIIYVSMSFSQIIPPSPSTTESKRLFYTSVSLLLSRIQGHHYHLSKFHIYMCYCRIKSQIQKALRKLTMLITKISIPRHNIVKLQETKDKDKDGRKHWEGLGGREGREETNL